MQKEKNRWFISFIKHIFKRPLGYSHLEKTGKCPLTMKWNVSWASKNHITRGEKAKIVTNAYGKGWEPLGAYRLIAGRDMMCISSWTLNFDDFPFLVPPWRERPTFPIFQKKSLCKFDSCFLALFELVRLFQLFLLTNHMCQSRENQVLTRHLRLGTWKVPLNMDDIEVFSHFFPFCLSICML